MSGRTVTLTNDEGELLFSAVETARRHAPDEDVGKRLTRLREKLRSGDRFVIEPDPEDAP